MKIFLVLISFLILPQAGIAQSEDCGNCLKGIKEKSLIKQKPAFEEIARRLKPNCKSEDNVTELTAIPLNADPAPESLTWAAFGEEFDNFMGVPAYSNKSTGGGKYQCTELVHRFMKDVFGVPTALGMGIGNGEVVAKNMSARFKDEVLENANTGNKKARLAYIENGCSHHKPVVGSLISIQYSRVGHVAVVREVKEIDENTIEIVLFEQHGVRRLNVGDKKQPTKIKMTRNTDGTWSGHQVVGWINVVEK